MTTSGRLPTTRRSSGFVNKMLLDAIKMGASDIHFEPYEKTYRVRFRTDGMLPRVAKPPRTSVRARQRLR